MQAHTYKHCTKQIHIFKNKREQNYKNNGIHLLLFYLCDMWMVFQKHFLMSNNWLEANKEIISIVMN